MGQYIATLQNPAAGGASNPAQVTFSFSEPNGGDSTDQANAASRVLVYLFRCNVWATGTTVTKIQRRSDVGGPAMDVPFPTFGWDSQNGVPGHVPTSGFPVAMGGGGGLTPRGTSVRVNEYSSLPGRSGRGWHNLPFLSASQVDGNGQLSAGSAGAIAFSTAQFLQGQDPDGAFGGPGMVPTIISRTLNQTNSVQSYTVSANLTNLRSRRR